MKRERKATQKSKPRLLYVASTASHLRRFHEPYLKALGEEADVYRMAAGDGEEIDFAIPFEKKMFSATNFRNIRRIRRILLEHRFDAVILNTTLAAFLVRAAMIGMRRRPYVHNIVHGYLFCEPSRGKKDVVLRLCERLLRGKTDRITVMNEEDLGIAKTYRLCKGEVSFIYGMGVDLNADAPRRNAELRAEYAGEGDLLCTFVGELSARKNQAFLIDAVKTLRDRGVPIKLMLVGEGGERAAYEAQIARLELSDAVFLLGNREPVTPYLAATDLYVSASRIEGLPFNVMEAMAFGLPILASDAKGQTDLLGAESIYPVDDMGAFCNAVEAFWRTGARGVGAVSYPQLARYGLDAVMETNLELMKRGWN